MTYRTISFASRIVKAEAALISGLRETTASNRSRNAHPRDIRTLTELSFREMGSYMTDIQKRDFAQTLARGLSCLEVLADAEPTSCSSIASAMEVSRAAARRILLTLESLGYVREDHGLYAATPKVLTLGRGMLGKGSVWSAVAPEVVAVANQVNEPCSVSVLDGLDILFVCRDSTRRIYTSRLGVGDRLPAHCSASGKMLLSSLSDPEVARCLKGVTLKAQGPASITDPAALKAALAEIRANDFAMAIDEMESGTLSISVPLRERGGRVVAALSVASHRSRKSPEDLKSEFLPIIRSASDRIQGMFRDFQDRGWILF